MDTATFSATDGTTLAYHKIGNGPPLVCLPGGPMTASEYLGDLGGMSAHRTLVLLDLRGTGDSAVPADTSTYRCDRQVDDVEALRIRLGLDRLDLAGHSAGGSLALSYVARYPGHVRRLVLLNPSPQAVGLEVADADRRELAELRRGEPWFTEAFAAFERIWAGRATDAEWDAITPFTVGRWDADIEAKLHLDGELRNEEAAAAFYASGGIDADVIRAAIARLPVSVLFVAGEHDVGLPPKRAAEYAALFPNSKFVVLSGAGHSPWLDEPEQLVATVSAFLD